VGHHGGGLFMADVDQTDAEAIGVDRQVKVGPAHDVEHGIDTFFLETLGNEPAAIDLRHISLLVL
jgi:hypothetical protein